MNILLHEKPICEWVQHPTKCGRKTVKQKLYFIEGERLTLRQMSEKYGIKYCTLWNRLYVQGLTPEQAAGV